MPYIEQRYRDLIDSEINALIEGLKRFDVGSTVPDGAINYAVTKIILTFFRPVTYFKIERVRGLLKGILSEYERREAIPYEDKKIEQNGDVY